MTTSLTFKPHQILAPILQVDAVAPQHFLFSLYAPEIANQAKAGQFLHILPRSSYSYDPFLRRAFSILDARPGSGEIDILFRAGGNGTAELSKRIVGDSFDIIGPLGQPFDIRMFHVKQYAGDHGLKPVLAGGGVGVPPLIFLSKTFKNMGVEPIILIGARSAEELLGLKQLRELQVETHVCTEDGSAGQTGRVTGLLETELQKAAEGASPSQAMIYACGPLPMLRAVAAVSERFTMPCQVSMEENMPCGIGVCNGCVVAMRTGEPPQGAREDVANSNSAAERADERYQRICVTGPAVWADRVDWEAS